MLDHLVVIKGAGDVASGVAFRLVRVGFPVIMTEIAQPTLVRRTVSFAQAVFDGETTVEGIRARLAHDSDQALAIARSGDIAVIVDPEARVVEQLRPTVVVDAIIAKRNLGTALTDAPIVIGLGPGFRAGHDVHAVIETNRGHWLGRAIFDGEAEPNTGVPAPVAGRGAERVLRAPAAGPVTPKVQIGDLVQEGQVVAVVDGQHVQAPFTGVIRGLVQPGLNVYQGMKIGDIDPRAAREHCFTISDKALAVGGGAVEAILYLLRQDE